MLTTPSVRKKRSKNCELAVRLAERLISGLFTSFAQESVSILPVEASPWGDLRRSIALRIAVLSIRRSVVVIEDKHMLAFAELAMSGVVEDEECRNHVGNVANGSEIASGSSLAWR